MPKYKADETQFELRINWGGTQYRTTVPKVLMDRIKKTHKRIHGTFIMDAKAIHLTVASED